MHTDHVYVSSKKNRFFFELKSINFNFLKDLAHWNQPGDRTN
jgi:hypothetical protein